jgi:hypothetical protein
MANPSMKILNTPHLNMQLPKEARYRGSMAESVMGESMIQ